MMKKFFQTSKMVRSFGLTSLMALSMSGALTAGAFTSAVHADDSDYYAADNYYASDNADANARYAQLMRRNTRNAVNVRGTVTNVSRNAFRINASNGADYRVVTNGSLSNLDEGDYVEVRGYAGQNSRIEADSVRILRNDNRNNNWNNGRNSTFSAYVTDDKRGNDAFMVSHNGREVMVKMRNGNFPPELERGDRVEIEGRKNGDLINAQRVRVVNRGGGWWDGSDNWNNQTLNGRVTDIDSDRVFTVQASNGRSYRVRSRSTPVRLTRGDWVQVRGTTRNNSFYANSVQITRNDDWNNNGSRVDITAVATTSGTTGFNVRENGRDFFVQSTAGVAVRSGDRVRIVGNVQRNTIQTNRVTILDRNNDSYDGRRVRLNGRVTSVSSNAFVVRDNDDGRTYRVSWGNARRLNVGDRVTVTGRMNGNTIIATDVD